MSNVIRLVNGGGIQVRTGVIQGIGPQGPRGVKGDPGPQGEQGPTGETGAMGAILKQGSLTTIGVTNPIAANTNTTIAFGTKPYDDLACFPAGSNSNIVMVSAGDYMFNCWLAFGDASAGSRSVWFQIGSTTVARTTRQSIAGAPFYVDLAMPWRTLGGETMNVVVNSAAALNISTGACAITMVGSGPAGPVGPQGPIGPVGPQGAKGDPGATGSASTGFATYSDLL